MTTRIATSEADLSEVSAETGPSAEALAGLPAELRADLARAHNSLLEAELATSTAAACSAAHRAALQGAAAVFRATGPRRRTVQPVQMWHLLAVAAPELGEWAAFFELVQPRVQAAASGVRVGQRQSDDLVRDAGAFLDAVTSFLSRHVTHRPASDRPVSDRPVSDRPRA